MKSTFNQKGYVLCMIFGLILLGVFFAMFGRIFLLAYIIVLFFCFAAAFRQLHREGSKNLSVAPPSCANCKHWVMGDRRNIASFYVCKKISNAPPALGQNSFVTDDGELHTAACFHCINHEPREKP